MPDHPKSFYGVKSAVVYVVASSVPDPKLRHDVGTNPADGAVVRIGYCAVVVLGVNADIISIGARLLVAACIGKLVPILEKPSPYPERD